MGVSGARHSRGSAGEATAEGFLVTEAECDQCLFSPNRVVSAARMKTLIQTCQRDDTHFVCHKASIAGHEVCCRGWFERFSSNFSRIAERLNMVRFVDPVTGRPSSTTDGSAVPEEGVS